MILPKNLVGRSTLEPGRIQVSSTWYWHESFIGRHRICWAGSGVLGRTVSWSGSRSYYTSGIYKL